MSAKPKIATNTNLTVTGDIQRPYRFMIAALTLLLNFSFGLNFFVVAPVTPNIIDDFEINRTMAGLLVGVVLLVQSVLSIPGCLLLNRIPLKILIGAAWLLCGATTLSFLAVNFPILLMLRVLFGVGMTLMIPALSPVLMQWFSAKELPLINGLNISVASGAIALSTFTAAPLANIVGWETALSIFGSISIIGSGAWMIFGRVDIFKKDQNELLSPLHIWKVCRSRLTVLLSVADAGPFAQYVALSAWLPTFYFEVHNIPLNQAGATVSLLPASGAVTVFLAGLIALRLTARRPFLIISGVIAILGGLASFLLGGTIAVYPSIILLGIGSWLYLPILLTIPMERSGTNPEDVAIMWATIVTVGSILSFVAPVVVGALADIFGTYVPGFSIFAVFAFSIVIAGFAMSDTLHAPLVPEEIR